MADKPQGFSAYFVVLATLFVTALVVSNIIAVKLIMIWGLLLPAAIIIFPFSYILGDVLTEVYGFRVARRVIWLGFICNALAVGAIVVAGSLPAAGFWDGQAAFERILGQAPWLVGASFTAYLAGEFANAYIMSRMKVAMNGRHLWMRTIASTLVGEGLDSAIFITIAFAGIMPIEALLSAIVTQWLVKSAYEALATPITYLTVGFLKRRDGVDAYDRNVNFNPFVLES